MSTITVEEMLAALNRGTLRLVDRGLDALPDDLSPLAGRLKVLDLSKNQLTALPDSLGALTALRTLIVADNRLAALPDAFAGLAALQILDLRRNRLKSLPPSLNHCAGLRTLRMASNKLGAVPDVIWHVGGIQTVDGIKGYPNGHRKQSFDAFYTAVHRVDRDPAARARVFDLFRGQPDASTPVGELFEALTFPHDAVRGGARDELLRRGAYAERPLAAGDAVVVLGNIHGARTALKERLKAVDIGYGTQVTERTTHVIIGDNPKAWDGIARPGLVFCAETAVVATLDDLDTPYLIEEAAESPEAARDVAEMLISPDRDTVAMGLELVTAGGVPEAVQTALFYVARGLGDKKLGAKARKLLKVHGTPKVQAAVADRSKLFSSGAKAEKKTAQALGAYRRAVPELDWARMALWIHRDHGVGLRFAVDRGDADIRREALRRMITDGTLDLFTHYAGYMPSFYSAYAHYDPITFAPEVFGFPEITGLTLRGCCIGALPPGIGALRNLKTLDLRGNFLSTLPDDLGALSGLRELRLGNNRFDGFPTAVISRLTGLERLTFLGNRSRGVTYRPRVYTVPDAVRAALPGCDITDGLLDYQVGSPEDPEGPAADPTQAR